MQITIQTKNIDPNYYEPSVMKMLFQFIPLGKHITETNRVQSFHATTVPIDRQTIHIL